MASTTKWTWKFRSTIRFFVVARDSKWARRRKIDLAGEPFVIPPGDTWGGALVVEAFRQRGLTAPTPVVSTPSIPLRNELAADGDFITLLTGSAIRTFARRYALKVLPVALPPQRSPVGIVILKNRMLGPVAQLFIESAREVAKSLAGEPDAQELTPVPAPRSPA
jgi:DNA-binding transcriptional LysR family regulator